MGWGIDSVARSIEIDWYLIKVSNIRRIIALVVIGVIAVGLLYLAHTRLNLPPEARARKAIEKAELSELEASEEVLIQDLRRELGQASAQLEAARQSYLAERWLEAEADAESADLRFQALAGSGSHQLAGVGEFFSLEGKVQLQRAGATEWGDAQHRMPVFNGDFVRSGRDGSAEILFTDGSLYRIAPDSLLEIKHNAKADSTSGTVKMRVGRIHVMTSGSSSTVTTETTETEISSDSRVAVDVEDGAEGRTRVAAFDGGARVRTADGGEVVLARRQQVETNDDGGLSATRPIPDPPLLLEPQNNASFDLKKDDVIALSWRGRDEDQAVHLQVSRSRRFTEDLLEVESREITGDGARLKAVAPGTYFWRASLITPTGVASEWSQVRRMRIYSSLQRAMLADRTAPVLSLVPTQQLGAMFIIQGRTEAGASVRVNGERAVTDSDGNFSKTIEIPREGWNNIEVVATDPAGNKTTRRERVFVEVY
ncbi:MAG: FecR domain-containing protein [Thermoanaerobaculales bacterium]|nr:FecR domain-containing protein [Thermoanaerobaculales bacterium]